MSYCVTVMSPFRDKGTYSYTGRSEITTPAACVDEWRGIPSSSFDVSISRFTRSSDSYSSRSSRLDSSADASVTSSSRGMQFATTSTSEYDIPSARPTSRTTARAAIVPNVTICATWSSP